MNYLGLTYTLFLITTNGFCNSLFSGDVTYILYTRELDKRVLNENNLDSVNSANPVYFIVHGWHGSANESWVLNLKSALLERQEANVIAVDWSEPADDSIYVGSRIDTSSVGKFIGELIVNLSQNYYNSNYNHFHLIGHSLGAHVCGYAGQTVKNLTNSKVYEIVGLDPAGPLFTLTSNSQRLSKGDGQLVVAIHTDAGYFGILGTSGHVDFFPNGGIPVQPGCDVEIIRSCSHSRSHEYYIEAVRNSSAFESVMCGSYAEYLLGNCNDNRKITMGSNITIADEGRYYLTTKSESPYSL